MRLTWIICLFLFSLAAVGQDSIQQARLKSLQGKIAPFAFLQNTIPSSCCASGRLIPKKVLQNAML
jgi:hypothetical protein